MIAINYEVNSNYFTLNNKKYSRVYQPVEMGEDSVAIYNIHDIKNQLLSTTNFTEISINGDYYGDRGSLMTALIPILYSGTTYSGGVGGNPIDWQAKLDQKEDKFDKNSAFNKNFGQTAGEVVEGNDVRITRGQTAFSWGDHSIAGYQTEDFTNLLTFANDEDAIAGGVAEGYLYIDEKTKLLRRVGTPMQDLLAYTSITSLNENADKHPIAQLRDITIDETITKLHPLELQGNRLYLKFTHEDGVQQVQSIDLSGLNLTETGITNATYDASTNVITLTENDGDVWQINLSEFSILNDTDVDGITTLTQEGVVKLTVSRVGQTGDFNHLLNTDHLESKEGAQSKADQAEANAINNIRIDGFVGEQKLNFGEAFIKSLDGTDTDVNTLIDGTPNGLYFKSTSSGKFVFKLDGNGNDDGFYIVNTPNNLTNNKDAQEIILNLTKDGVLNLPNKIIANEGTINSINFNSYPGGRIIEGPNWNSIAIGLKANAVNDKFEIISRDLADASDRNADFKNTVFSVNPLGEATIGNDVTIDQYGRIFAKEFINTDSNNTEVLMGGGDTIHRSLIAGYWGDITTPSNRGSVVTRFTDNRIGYWQFAQAEGIAPIDGMFFHTIYNNDKQGFLFNSNQLYLTNFDGNYTKVITENDIGDIATSNDYVTDANFSSGTITLNRGSLSDINFDIGNYYALANHNHDETYLNKNLGGEVNGKIRMVASGSHLELDGNDGNKEIRFSFGNHYAGKIRYRGYSLQLLAYESMCFFADYDPTNSNTNRTFAFYYGTSDKNDTDKIVFEPRSNGIAWVKAGVKVGNGTGDRVLLDDGTTKLLSELGSGGTSDGNDYVTDASFSDGTITLNRGNLSDITFNLGSYYALTNHNHDSDYANINHNHDNEYIKGVTAGDNITINDNGDGTFTINSTANNDLDYRYAIITQSNQFQGTVSAPRFNQSSLRKLKKNVKPFEKDALELIDSLDIVTYDLKDGKGDNQIGVIADDTKDEFLSEEKDGVDLYKMVSIQAKAIQELEAKITRLEAKLNQ